jgi:hypothetical protein
MVPRVGLKPLEYDRECTSPFLYTPDGPSLRSEHGVEQYRRRLYILTLDATQQTPIT